MQPGLCPLQQPQASAGCSRPPPEGKARVRGKGNEAGGLHHPPHQAFRASAGKPQVLGEGIWSWQVPCPSCPCPLLLLPLSTSGLLCIPRDDGGRGGLTQKTQCPMDEGTEGSSQNGCGVPCGLDFSTPFPTHHEVRGGSVPPDVPLGLLWPPRERVAAVPGILPLGHSWPKALGTECFAWEETGRAGVLPPLPTNLVLLSWIMKSPPP